MFQSSDPKGQCVGYWCSRVGLSFKGHLEQHAKQVGLTGSQVILLIVLAHHGSSSLVELARQMEHAHPSVLRHLDDLEAAGFIRRIPHPHDRRKKDVQLTQTGLAIIPTLNEIMMALRETALTGIPPDDVQALVKTLRQVAANLGVSSGEGGDCREH